MDANFWHQRWESNTIGFHQKQPNALLVAHFNALSVAPGGRVFLPLCGKTLDIGWLLSHGYRVAGAELSELAIQQCFAELGLKPQITAQRYTLGESQCLGFTPRFGFYSPLVSRSTVCSIVSRSRCVTVLRVPPMKKSDCT